MAISALAPLLEFEISLLADGPGAALADQTFRLRSYLTPEGLLGYGPDCLYFRHPPCSAPAPVRLAYGGDVMRVVPDVLNPERQLVQPGQKLLAAMMQTRCGNYSGRGLQKAGIKALTLDLGLPHLAELLLGESLMKWIAS